MTSGAAAQTYNSTVPYVGYFSVFMAQNEANGDYNSLQIAFRGTSLKNDLTYQVGYTYSNANDSFNGMASSGGDFSQVSNPYQGWKYHYGPSGLDIRNIFFANFVYDLPLLNDSTHSLLKTALGGWEISGIVTATTGAPLNIGLNGQNVASIVPHTSNRPNVSGPMINPHTVQKWFDTSVFSMPAPGTWGNEPPNGFAAQAATIGISPFSRTSFSIKSAARGSNSARNFSTFGTTRSGLAILSTVVSAPTMERAISEP